MKKILIVLLLLVLVFGCAKTSEDSLADTVKDDQKTEETKADAKVDVEETVEKEAEPVEKVITDETTDIKEDEIGDEETDEQEGTDKEEVKTEETTTEQVQTKLQQLLNKLDTKVKNFKYNYGKPPLTTEVNDYQVQLKNSKGKDEYLIRIDLYEYDEMPLMPERWDTVFIIPDTKEAVLFCLDRTYCQNKEKDKTNESEEAEYDEYITKTPFDWANEIPTNARIIGPELIDKKSVTNIEYIGTNGQKYNMWLDSTYGVPVQIITKTMDGKEMKHLYKDMSFNTGKDENFKKPF